MLKRFLPDKVSPAVKAEQIRLLYHQGITIQLLGIVTAFIAVAMFWAVADHTMLSVWLAAMIILSVVRLVVTFRFEQLGRADFEVERWGNIYIAGTFLSGIVWGSLAFFFDPSWPAPYQVILFVIFTGVIAGAFNTNSSLFIAFPAFFAPLVVCLMYVSVQQDSPGSYELTLLFVIYFILMYSSSLKFNRRLIHALSLRFQNEELAEKLAQSNAKLTQLADMDALTQIYNRRSMDRCLLAEWERHYRNQKPLSLLFIDIDQFKQYNDAYGHEGGDQCLVKVAQVISANAQRASDMATRFGGEEFAVILPETEPDAALHIAQKMSADLRALCIPHPSSGISECVTMSIGVATMIPQEPANAELLLAAADKALYQAKERGRDRVVTAESATASPETSEASLHPL